MTRTLAAVLVGVLLVSSLARAQAWQWRYGGHLKAAVRQLRYDRDDLRSRLGGDRHAGEVASETRLTLEGRSSNLDVRAHYELLGEFGDAPEARNQVRAAGATLLEPSTLVPDERTRVLDLADEVSEGDRHRVVQRLDRLSLGYHSLRTTVRIGRQTITWGNGLAFQVLDLVSPYSPTAVDKDYKPGEDMVFGQYLLDDGGDLQVAAVGRRDPVDDELSAEHSTFAAKRRWTTVDGEISAVAGRQNGEALLGLGIARDWHKAVWRVDASLARTREDDIVVSGLVNVDRFWDCGGRNCYGYLEYYHNGFGVDDADFDAADAELLTRLQRGQLFVLGRDYLAAGFELEWTPRLELTTDTLWNLRDGSTRWRLQARWEPEQDLELKLGALVSAGGGGGEFSGLPLEGRVGAQGYSDELYARLVYYF